MFHFHKWSGWVVTERGKVLYDRNSSIQMGHYLTQERYCELCTKTQIKTQKTTVRSDVTLVPEFKYNPYPEKINSL